MRAVFACVAMLVAAPASADNQLPAGPAPAPTPAPQTGEPPSDQPAPPQPKVNPAYGEKPDPAFGKRPDATEDPYYGSPAGKDIYIKSYPDRSHKNMMGLAIAGGASVVLGGIGLYFHLDSRDKSSEINAHKFTGAVWTDERQETYDAANRSAVVAGVFYGIGGAVLLGAAIAYMITEPKMETMVIHPHTNPRPTALVAPTRGGAMVGGSWSF